VAESNLLCLARKIRIRIDQSVFILAVWKEGEDPTEPIGVLKSDMQPLQESKALLTGPKISDFALAISKQRKRLVHFDFGYLPHKLYYQMLLCTNERMSNVPGPQRLQNAARCCKPLS
jgi:hypothetical protein